MLDNVRELLNNPKYNDLEVNGMKLKELLSYVRIDKVTNKEMSYEEAMTKPHYMIQRYQLLDDTYQDELYTKLFGESRSNSEIALEYLSFGERMAREVEENEEIEEEEEE